MVNFGLNSASVLGIFLAIAGAGLYFLRSVRPELSRDHDIFFAAVGLLCGLILLFQGWRLDPILQFGQFLLTGSAIFFAAESIRLRGATTEQARRSSSFIDNGRRVSKTRVYTEAELDNLDSYENKSQDYRNNPRLKGTSDLQDNRRLNSKERIRRSRSNRPSSRTKINSNRNSDNDYGVWENVNDVWANNSDLSRTSRKSRSRLNKKNRNKSFSSETNNYNHIDYVDYQPLEKSELEYKAEDNNIRDIDNLNK
ncbi:Ycf66 family protein [Candidatus Atelocyanobacterium thalassae]|jgi:hypothetical protein|uniref:Ycf66 protein N-terminus n=1 Tax=Atelocyanobacterium thalassa (isolate ALOHA) TaxID=1453429 RepID=D3ENW0_ATETH|nr:Ycf66 family protein [Candidatus Atelocyanobacterium thalassa]ADB95160.1 Ycf66 protein N-terminus [Candidatus Atelocyanobacterium thalassa isolate ALOHA]MCH2543168.1 Ycf66 family protein [Candidatus Atelocyanobacterium sp. ALOHA_A2.5_9]|tara:strand:- start:28553 stop:29314 length:762 start_codon:yes stop_codon:yes gene_type:complete